MITVSCSTQLYNAIHAGREAQELDRAHDSTFNVVMVHSACPIPTRSGSCPCHFLLWILLEAGQNDQNLLLAGTEADLSLSLASVSTHERSGRSTELAIATLYP